MIELPHNLLLEGLLRRLIREMKILKDYQAKGEQPPEQLVSSIQQDIDSWGQVSPVEQLGAIFGIATGETERRNAEIRRRISEDPVLREQGPFQMVDYSRIR